MEKLTSYVIPIFIFSILLYSYIKKVDVYSTFLEGAKEGMEICFNIFPAMIAMIFAVNLFLDSNVLNFLLSPLNSVINLAPEVIPMAFLRPISGNASLAIMTNIFQKYGPDSFNGLLASVLQGCTDTTIYVIALYYSSIKVSKTRYTIIVGLLADVVGILMGFLLTNLFFK